MAENWPWESSSRAATSNTQQLSSSPIQSGSSQSSQEAATIASATATASAPAFALAPATEFQRGDRSTLEETLRTCLTTAAPSTSPPSAATAGPSSPLRQTATKPGMKRKSRASRRVPTTVVEATCSDFRITVHKLTGMASPPAVAAPVRPMPQRPPSSIRPTPRQLPYVARVPQAPRAQPLTSLWEDPGFTRRNAATSTDGIDIGIDLGIPAPNLRSSMAQSISAPTGSLQTFWDPPPQPSFLMNPTTTAPFDAPATSSSLQENFDDWFPQDHSVSDYMR